jgi:hypothetical protein
LRRLIISGLVGVLALTGCYMPGTPISPDITPSQGTATATEVVPAYTESSAPIMTTHPTEANNESTEVTPLTEEEEIQILFEQGVNDSNKSMSLLTIEDLESFVDEDATASSVKSVADILNALLSQGYMEVEIPLFAASIIDEVKKEFPEANIATRGVDEEGKVLPTPEGYYSVDTMVFAAGGSVSFVKDPQGFWLVILPKGEKNVDEWIIGSISQEVDFVRIRSEASFGKPTLVKVPGAENFRLVQVDDEGKVWAILNRGVKVDDYASKIWTIQEEGLLDIPFDKSNPQTITVEGNEYEGYLMEDKYGSRLVDETNNIILIKGGDGWREPVSRMFSEEYPAVSYETKIGHADGFEIPITLGLARNLSQCRNFVYSEAHMTQLGADDLALLYLRSSWKRYTDVMKHPGVTYEQYLDILRQGRGNLDILDVLSNKRVSIDPRQGFSVVITGDDVYDMPTRSYNSQGFYFGADERGRLLFANDTANFFSSLFMDDSYSDAENGRHFLFISTAMIVYFSILGNECLKGQVERTCGEFFPDMEKLGAEFLEDFYNYRSKLSDDPLFILR